MTENILLIGYGSVAKQYELVASELGKRVYFFDPKVKKSNSAVFYNINALSETESSRAFDSIIFCDYSFTRVRNYKKVAKLKTKSYIFEKLVSNDLFELEFLRSEYKSKNDIVFKTHLRWNILNLDKKIQSLQTNYRLGKLVNLNVTAGNCCISMGGAHWLGLFLELFQVSSCDELKIASDFEISYESPRSKDIPMLSGYLAISISDKNVFNINFVKDSHIAPITLFLFEFGRIIMTFDGKLQVQFLTEPEGIAAHAYRSPKFSLETYDAYSTDENPFKLLLSTNPKKIQLEEGIKVSEIMIAATLNNKESPKTFRDILINKSALPILKIT